MDAGAFGPARIPIRKPAVAPMHNGLLAPELAAGNARLKSAKSIGVRSGKLAYHSGRRRRS
jgi:hypothetical protein